MADGYDVVVNKPQTSAYRAPGATNAAFALETVIDEICTQLKIDPLEFRPEHIGVRVHHLPPESAIPTIVGIIGQNVFHIVEHLSPSIGNDDSWARDA